MQTGEANSFPYSAALHHALKTPRQDACAIVNRFPILAVYECNRPDTDRDVVGPAQYLDRDDARVGESSRHGRSR